MGRPPAPDKTGLYVGLGVGGVILVIALGYAMSSGGGEAPRAKNSVDPAVLEELGQANALAHSGKLADALAVIERTILNPAYAESKYLNDARQRANDLRKTIDHYDQAEKAIQAFEDRVEASKKAQTAMAQADAFWKESGELLGKYGGTPTINKVLGIRTLLERWRGTNSAGEWAQEYNYTRDRILRDFLQPENFSGAIGEWRRFAESYGSSELQAKVNSEYVEINLKAAAAATKLVQGAGTGPGAKAKLEEAQSRFMNTDGQKIIAQKLKTLN